VVNAPGTPDNDGTEAKGGSGTFPVAEGDADDASRLESLTRFKAEATAMLVHDMKSPLTAMLMNLDFAIDELASSGVRADVRTALLDSRVAGARLFRMIANLLDIARSDDGRLVPKRTVIDVQGLFERVVAEHAAEARAIGVSLRHSVDEETLLEVDPDLLGRVLSTLVESALRRSKSGGWIGLQAGRTPPDPAGVRTPFLTVTNDGAPLADEWPLENGRGAPGLYFCRVAVLAHGGTIDLVSAASAPTTCFRIEVPD
jgi:signal transduction histidine kinase